MISASGTGILGRPATSRWSRTAPPARVARPIMIIDQGEGYVASDAD